MAIPSDVGYDFGEESDPNFYDSDAPPSPLQSAGDYMPSPEPTANSPLSPDYRRSYSRSPLPEYISPMISKPDGNYNSDTESEEDTPVAMPRPKRAASRRQSKKPTPSKKRSFPPPSGSDDEAPRAKRRRPKRVWSEEDEVKLLKEMAKLKKSGKEPIADLELFYQVHRYVNSDCTHSQLTDKVRRLKSKYVNTKETARTKGEDPVFPTTHEERLYDLSKRVWGCVGGDGHVKPSANGRKRARKPPGDDNGGDDEVRKKLVEFCLKYNGNLSEDVLRNGVSLMGSGRVKELDKLYKQVRTKEIEVEMLKAGLLREILEEVCDDGTG